MIAPVTVAIPVGPSPVHQKYLGEALESVVLQTQRAAEVLIIDDMAGLPPATELRRRYLLPNALGVRIWRAPWLLGVAHAFNAGVALAGSDHVLMLGADDRLQPWALADFARTWERFGDALGYYWFDVEYSDGETQALACNAAVVTKALWQHTGGFPVESAVGAPDSCLISIMLGAEGAAGHLYRIESGRPPYWCRRHPASDTAARAGRFSGAIWQVRDALTAGWQRPEWGRMGP